MPAIRIKLPKTDIFMMKITVRQELYLNFVPSTNPKPVMIIVESKRKKMETLEKEYPGAMIIDVTSHADNEFVQFSPFYPHGGIPVPFTDYISAESVEGIWQGLKVFENYNIDTKLGIRYDECCYSIALVYENYLKYDWTKNRHENDKIIGLNVEFKGFYTVNVRKISDARGTNTHYLPDVIPNNLNR